MIAGSLAMKGIQMSDVLLEGGPFCGKVIFGEIEGRAVQIPYMSDSPEPAKYGQGPVSWPYWDFATYARTERTTDDGKIIFEFVPDEAKEGQ